MEADRASSKLWIVADGDALNALLGPGVLTSGGPVVFVDDAVGDVAPVDLAGGWLVVARQWGCKLASAYSTVLGHSRHLEGADRAVHRRSGVRRRSPLMLVAVAFGCS